MLFKRRHTEGQDREPAMIRWFGKTFGSLILFSLEIVQIIVIAAAIIVPVRVFLVKPFVVKGASMEPNFYNDEYLIIDEISYRFKEIERGQIVVFQPPNNGTQFYIKRVIGLPGEEVQIEDGVITIFNAEHPDGVVVDEPYIDVYTQGRTRVKLGDDQYYVFGDNRNHSLDSRSFGPITKEAIVGRVWLRGLPVDRVGTIPMPEYNL